MQKIIRQQLLFWYRKNKRPLPWRDTGNAYYVLLSEIMLQQTRIEAVKKYFLRFIQALPDMEALAKCEESFLMKLWEGLGYYSRAGNLKKTAEIICAKGYFPETKEELLTLPGIGKYTAGAVSSIAFGQKACAVDGNVLRVLSRFLGKDISTEKAEIFLMKYFPVKKEDAADYTQSWMELGETLCLPKGEISCGQCPLQEKCIAKKKNIISLLPSPKEKKEKKLIHYTLLLLEYKGSFAIEQRPSSKGLLASLWQFPLFEGVLTEKEIRALPVFAGESKVEKITFLYDATHIFTHIQWQMHCYHIRLDSPVPGLLFVKKEDLETVYAIPSAFRKIKNTACNSGQESVY